MKTNVTSSLEERALALLAGGLTAARVAEALGVDASRISQLVSNPEFSTKLADAKFEAIHKHNQADAELDDIEAKVRAQLLQTIDTVYKPLELTRILQVVNASKRRGSGTPTAIVEQNQILNLVMPTKIINKFVTNVTNQVIQTGNAESGTTDLLTMQSSTLANNLKRIEEKRVLDHEQANRNGS